MIRRCRMLLTVAFADLVGSSAGHGHWWIVGLLF
jgi:hypothetical protein